MVSISDRGAARRRTGGRLRCRVRSCRSACLLRIEEGFGDCLRDLVFVAAVGRWRPRPRPRRKPKSQPRPEEREGVKELLAIVAKDASPGLPNDARASLLVLAAQLQALQTTIGAIEKRIVVQHRANKQSKRLQTIPGIGPIGASAIAATVTNPKIFRSGRDFAAWIGLVPRQMSTGGKAKLGPISKQGDRYLRRLLVVGAVSTLRRAKQNPQKFPWVTRLLARRPYKVVAVALANKMARTAWALLNSDKTCRFARFAAA